MAQKQKRKVCIVVTARTSYTKIKPVINAVNTHPGLDMQIICAASSLLERYGRVDTLIEADGYTVDKRVYMLLDGENLTTTASSTGLGVIEFASAFDALQPDLVFIMADRYEIMSAAIAASYMNIPIAHAQGGEVSGNIDEKVRHAVTKLSDIHLVATAQARDWLIRMGELPERVHHTGCPSIDVAKNVIARPEISGNVYEKYGGVGATPALDGPYVIVMQHPVTSEYEDSKSQINETLYAMKDLPVPVMWFWPNVDAGAGDTSKAIRAFREHESAENFHFFKNMPPEDFLRLLYNSSAIIGNSSVAIREGAFLGTPAVNIGCRQNLRERSKNVIDVGHDRDAIRQAVDQQIAHGKYASSNVFGDGTASNKIADILATTPLNFSKVLSYALQES